MANNKKTLYHSEMTKMGPVEITVIKEKQKSRYQGKPDYVTLLIDGQERYYHAETQSCADYFDGLAGQTFVAVFENSREDAIINCVGTSGTQAAAPKQPEQTKPPVTSQRGKRPGEAAAPATQPPQERQPAPAPAKSAVKSDADYTRDIRHAKAFLGRQRNLTILCDNAARSAAAEVLKHDKTAKWTDEKIQAVASTLFIEANRAGIGATLPPGPMEKYLTQASDNDGAAK